MEKISKKTTMIMLAVAAVIAAILLVFALRPDKTKQGQLSSSSGSQQTAPKTTDLSKVNVLMIPPLNSELNEYQDISSSSEKGYLSFATADKQCSFSFGIKSKAQQPGSDLGDMVAKLGEKMRGQGYQVKISDAPPLKLAAENDPSVTYDFPRKQLLLTVPSAHFQALEYFGAVIRRDGYRLNTIEVCNDKSGQLSRADLDRQLQPITEVLSHITIRATD